jgi:hypothetical protein
MNPTMKQKFLLLAALCVMLTFALETNAQNAASSPQDAVIKDYPSLSEMYGMKELEKQKAHYIFAIDVSSFMSTNLQVIKPLIKEFIKALPDGDQVTFIRKSSTENTDYVQNIKSITINDEVRRLLPQILDGSDFAIQNAGSDGYAMTNKILDAIMNPMSEGLVFVFMFTDFEYWTSGNQYDKKKVDWTALKDKFQPFIDLTNGDQSRVVFPYAFYFRDNEYREQADYRPELKEIFGSLNQPPVGEASILRAFFTNMEANALVYRLKYKVFLDMAKVDLSSNLVLTEDDQIMATVSNAGPENFPLFTQFDYRIVSEPSCLEETFIKDTATRHNLDEPFVIYQLNRGYNPILPRFVNLGDKITFHVTPLCDKYVNELEMLNGLDESLKLDYAKGFEFEEELPKGNYFFHILPGWLDILILALIFIWLLCLLITFLLNKFGGIYRSWNVMVTTDDGDEQNTYSQSYSRAKKVTVTPSSLGIQNGGNWKFEILTVDGPIYNFWKPRGYYIQRGCPMSIKHKGKTKALPRSPYRVTPLKKWGTGCTLTFNNNDVDYSIRVQ